MNELKGLLILCLVLGGLAFASLNHEPSGPKDDEVALLGGPAEGLSAIRFFSESATVSVVRDDGYAIFEMTTKKGSQRFVGGKKTADLMKSFAPFIAVRSLGRPAPEALESLDLVKPPSRLEIERDGRTHVFDIGGKTFGAADDYIRPQGGAEVFVVRAAILNQLRTPQSKFMQRTLRSSELGDIVAMRFVSEGRSRKILHGNRHAANLAFWATEASPQERNETLTNFVGALHKLTIADYGGPDDPVVPGIPVIQVKWLGANDHVLEGLDMSKRKVAEGFEYIVMSSASRLPARVSKSAAEQLEKDLGVFFAQ